MGMKMGKPQGVREKGKRTERKGAKERSSRNYFIRLLQLYSMEYKLIGNNS